MFFSLYTIIHSLTLKYTYVSFIKYYQTSTLTLLKYCTELHVLSPLYILILNHSHTYIHLFCDLHCLTMKLYVTLVHVVTIYFVSFFFYSLWKDDHVTKVEETGSSTLEFYILFVGTVIFLYILHGQRLRL